METALEEGASLPVHLMLRAQEPVAPNLPLEDLALLQWPVRTQSRVPVAFGRTKRQLQSLRSQHLRQFERVAHSSPEPTPHPTPKLFPVNQFGRACIDFPDSAHNLPIPSILRIRVRAPVQARHQRMGKLRALRLRQRKGFRAKSLQHYTGHSQTPVGCFPYGKARERT